MGSIKPGHMCSFASDLQSQTNEFSSTVKLPIQPNSLGNMAVENWTCPASSCLYTCHAFLGGGTE